MKITAANKGPVPADWWPAVRRQAHEIARDHTDWAARQADRTPADALAALGEPVPKNPSWDDVVEAIIMHWTAPNTNTAAAE